MAKFRKKSEDSNTPLIKSDRVNRTASKTRSLSVRGVEESAPQTMTDDYVKLLDDLKSRIQASQIQAALAVNSALIELYWHIGETIVKRQEAQGWGTSIVDRLAKDIQSSFPGIRGFSRQNMWKMRAFYLAWTQEVRNLSQPVRDLDGLNLPQAVREIPWGHNIEIFFKVKDPAQRLWYSRQTTDQGWSRAVLVHQIETGAYHRSGKAITNFATTLPAPDSDLAQQLLKDPYNFDFLTLAEDAMERDLEVGLIEHLKKFLLELGIGFAFVGQQFAIEIGGEDFYIDLLFYHLRLRRFVVIDLKVEEFKPEFVGKMNFYLSAMDAQFRHDDDQPSIGLILCKTRNRLVAEYALRDTSKPMGVATYAATLPPMLRGNLPTPDELAHELSRVEPSADELKENQ